MATQWLSVGANPDRIDRLKKRLDCQAKAAGLSRNAYVLSTLEGSSFWTKIIRGWK